tara:strand:- start:1129 stop:2130 length:1002 start_codon:yes stop_codon:yes gene_type:complete
MGFFSKVWKGVKKGFKAVFKPIKAVFKKVGKFMNKIGIVGQIALMFIPIPGLGAIMSQLGSMTSGLLGGASTALGASAASGNILAQGAKFMLDGAMKVGAKVGQGFKTLTEGVKSFVSNSSKYLANKIPGVTIKGAPTSFFGPGSESVLGRTSAIQSKNFNAFMGRTPAVEIVPPNPAKATAAATEETGSSTGKNIDVGSDASELEGVTPTDRSKSTWLEDKKAAIKEYVSPGDDGVGLMGNTFDTAKEKVGGRLLNMATDSLLAGSPEQMELERPQMQPYISDYRSNMPVLAPEQTRFGFEDMANYIVAPMRLDMSGDSSSVWGNFASQRTV